MTSTRRLLAVNNRLWNWIVPVAPTGDEEDDDGVAAVVAGELQPLFPNHSKQPIKQLWTLDDFGGGGGETAATGTSLRKDAVEDEGTALHIDKFNQQQKDQQDEEKEHYESVVAFADNVELSLFHLHNLAIPMSYLVFGLMQGLVKTFLNVYPLDCGATESQQTTLASITTLPCAMKILYGFVSDNCPMCGYRRKPYIFLGWCVASGMAAVLLVSCDLSVTTPATTTTTTTIATSLHQQSQKQQQAPSMEFLSLIFFVLGIGIWFADSVCDAVVAEKTQREAENKNRPAGTIQSTCYVARYAGILSASTISTYLYSSDTRGGGSGPQTVVLCIAALPWLLFPFLYHFKEDRNVEIQSVQHQSTEIWKTICSRPVWEPMSFIYIFNLLQVPNPAWRQFLSTVYHFSSMELNLLVVTTYALLLGGMILYKCCFLQTSWRRIFIICIAFNAIASSLQLVMICGKIPSSWNTFWFALGDDALVELMHGIQKLPITILMMSLCPVGSEGVSYAMLTTLDNSAHMLSQALSTALLGIGGIVGDTSKAAFEAGHVRGIFHLSLVTTLLQVSPIAVIAWMPRNRNELFALRDKAWSGSPLGGVVFLVVLVASMIWTVTISLLNIVDPDWNGGF